MVHHCSDVGRTSPQAAAAVKGGAEGDEPPPQRLDKRGDPWPRPLDYNPHKKKPYTEGKVGFSWQIVNTFWISWICSLAFYAAFERCFR